MFATLLGAMPRPPLADDADPVALVEAVVRAQEAAGLEPITDGGLGEAGSLGTAVEAWETTASLTSSAVKAVLTGPFSGAWRRDGMSAPDRQASTLALAVRLNTDLRALAAAGCPLIEIHEPAAVGIATDPAERALFREAHLRLLDGVADTHLSLALTGGNADTAGIDTFLSAPYASLAVDLIAGPDNWRLVVATPGDRGIICGALSATAGSDDGPEILLWAAGYAASTAGRGPGRVGLATSSSMAGLPWEAATAKLGRLGEAVRISRLPADERRAAVDPRSLDARSAALGRAGPRPDRPGR